MSIKINFIENPTMIKEIQLRGDRPILIHNNSTGKDYIGLIAQTSANKIQLLFLDAAPRDYILNRSDNDPQLCKSFYNASDFNMGSEWTISQPRIDIIINAYKDEYE